MAALVTDELWDAIGPHLPSRKISPKGGRPAVPDRACLAGILFVLREGIRWQSLPMEMGCSGSTCWRRFRQWTAAGVWTKAHLQMLETLGTQGMLNLEREVIDSASTRALKGGHTPAPIRLTGPKKAAKGT
jgi:transposase